MPTGRAAIVLYNCSCFFGADLLQGRNSFVRHIYLLYIVVTRVNMGAQFDAGSKEKDKNQVVNIDTN